MRRQCACARPMAQRQTVYVPDGVYDLSKLGNGYKFQVNSLEAYGIDNTLSAANIWPVN